MIGFVFRIRWHTYNNNLLTGKIGKTVNLQRDAENSTLMLVIMWLVMLLNWYISANRQVCERTRLGGRRSWSIFFNLASKPPLRSYDDKSLADILCCKLRSKRVSNNQFCHTRNENFTLIRERERDIRKLIQNGWGKVESESTSAKCWRTKRNDIWNVIQFEMDIPFVMMKNTITITRCMSPQDLDHRIITLYLCCCCTAWHSKCEFEMARTHEMKCLSLKKQNDQKDMCFAMQRKTASNFEATNEIMNVRVWSWWQ